MYKLFITIVCLIGLQNLQAQEDTLTPKKTDTIRVGNLVIVSNKSHQRDSINISLKTNSKDNLVTVNEDTLQIGRIQITKSQDSLNKKDWQTMFENGDFRNTNIKIGRAPKKLKDITTNWWILDLGFANYIDHSQPIYYMASNFIYDPRIVFNTDMKLNNKKSSNVNVWVVQQKVNLYKHQFNLKYGIGFEMFNLRFDRPVSFRENNWNSLTMDTILFSKNKLFVKYLTIPLQLNFHPHPEKRKSFYASIGVSAGYLIKARNKQISDERGKQKYTGNFNLNDWRFATIGELGIGSVRLYGSYGMNNLFDKTYTHFDFQPYALGVRFSHF